MVFLRALSRETCCVAMPVIAAQACAWSSPSGMLPPDVRASFDFFTKDPTSLFTAVMSGFGFLEHEGLEDSTLKFSNFKLLT